MPFEVALDVTPREVTPQEGKGALGAWWASWLAPERDSEPTNLVFDAVSSGGANLWRKGCMRASA